MVSSAHTRSFVSHPTCIGLVALLFVISLISPFVTQQAIQTFKVPLELSTDDGYSLIGLFQQSTRGTKQPDVNIKTVPGIVYEAESLLLDGDAFPELPHTSAFRNHLLYTQTTSSFL